MVKMVETEKHSRNFWIETYAYQSMNLVGLDAR